MRRWAFVAFVLGVFAGAAFAVDAEGARFSVAPATRDDDGRTEVRVVVENVGDASVTVAVSFETRSGDAVRNEAFVVRPRATADREGPAMEPGDVLRVIAFFQGPRGRGSQNVDVAWDDCDGGDVAVRFQVDASRGMTLNGTRVECA